MLNRLDCVQQRIQSLVRRLIGIGLGNQFSPPGMFLNCQAIALCELCLFRSSGLGFLQWKFSSRKTCFSSLSPPPPPFFLKSCQGLTVSHRPRHADPVGDCFHDRRDQEAMIAILKKTEKDHMRPITDSALHLIESWEGVPDGRQLE